jgi:glycosyltransferase involved in cell wall biosynthesis
MPDKNILLFATSLNTGGGTERVLVNLANALNKRGFRIQIIVNVIGDNELFELNNEIIVTRYWYGNIKSRYRNKLLLKILNKVFNSLILDIFLKRIAIGKNSIIVSFSNSITIDCFGTSFKNKLISFEHWPYWITNKTPKLQKKINTIYPKLKKVIVLTEYEKKVYESLGCDVQIIPNAYTFFPENKSDLSQKIVLSIGHFNAQKRRDLLIKAWAIVHNKHKDWNLIIVGDGSQLKENIKLIEELKIFNSIQIVKPTNQILDYYLKSSIFVISSEYEALPMVLIEAKACGLPCVSFDVISGPNELIKDKEDGFLVPFPDTKELAHKMNLLIEDEGLRGKFGKNARIDILNRFNPSNIYSSWEVLLKNF